MIPIRILRRTARRVQILRRQRSLHIRRTLRAQKSTILTPEPIDLRSLRELDASFDRFAVGGDLEAVERRVAVGAVGGEGPLGEEGAGAETGERGIGVDEGGDGEFGGEVERTEAIVPADVLLLGRISARVCAGAVVRVRRLASGRVVTLCPG